MNTTKHIQSLTPILITAIHLFTSSPASASQPDSTEPHIKATLHAPDPLIPGETLIIAITLDIDEHWHTYWPGINDTGYGLSLDFTPVDGLAFGVPYFPTPTRHIAPGNILDHIYENQIQILIPVDADPSIIPSDTLTINATINYLICKDLCIPESTNATVTLRTASPKPQSADEPKSLTDLQGAFYISRPMHLNNTIRVFDPVDHTITTTTDGLTGPASDPQMDAQYYADNQWQDNQIKLTINGATHYTFFPDNNCTQPADLITQGDTESKTLTITFDRRYEDDPTTPARLSGRLRAKFNHGWREFDIHYIEPQ